ncbi:hypothetical protein EPIR_0352 [Erwinia piriflorinigrans CFBP 5888]|uniref:Uncharacterized protein n=1 Tax=Erwinia piriflorinigrans CFBP 5888 TaxID=1161919 RepID=V5Z371_9GAMM|nr:hypothetical protein EPIR_0352 [Erwinia piriflorinigrans CFBP 5888]
MEPDTAAYGVQIHCEPIWCSPESLTGASVQG